MFLSLTDSDERILVQQDLLFLMLASSSVQACYFECALQHFLPQSLLSSETNKNGLNLTTNCRGRRCLNHKSVSTRRVTQNCGVALGALDHAKIQTSALNEMREKTSE